MTDVQRRCSFLETETSSQYYLVSADYTANDVDKFGEKFMRDLEKSKAGSACTPQQEMAGFPRMIISIAGGTKDFKMYSSISDPVFEQGIIKVVEQTKGWIITTGNRGGVSEHVGTTIATMDAEGQYIGIVALKKIVGNNMFDQDSVSVEYTARTNESNKSALQPHHTKFILVDSHGDGAWDDELRFRQLFETFYAKKDVPVIVIVISGGVGTIETMESAIERDLPILLVAKTGRACDAVVSYMKSYKDGTDKSDDWTRFLETETEDRSRVAKTAIEKIRKYPKLEIYEPSEDDRGMELTILRTIIKHSKCAFHSKLKLAVHSSRVELVAEVLQQRSADVDDQQRLSDQDALNECLCVSLEKKWPEICDLLLKHGAQVTISMLEKLSNWKIAADIRFYAKYEVTRKLANTLMSDAKQSILSNLHLLAWAIRHNQPPIAKAIWNNTDFQIHSALLAAFLYDISAESDRSQEEDHLTNKLWFEERAKAILSEARDFDEATSFLRHEWVDLNNQNALKIAKMGKCKEFISHFYVQRWSTNEMYADKSGSISPETSVLWILLYSLLCFPILMPGSIYRSTENTGSFLKFYKLRVVKLAYGTLSYIVFLAVLTVTMLTINFDNGEILLQELLLWTYVVSYTVEEILQVCRNGKAYLDTSSNRVDIAIIVGIASSFVIKMVIFAVGMNSMLMEAYVIILIITTIVCYVRLLNVFSLSKRLGPITFVLTGLIWDVFEWLIIFFVFMVGFQIGMSALTRQARVNPWTLFPHGTLGLAFAAIAGMDDSAETLYSSRFGVFFLLVYAVIAQIILVNLLIAMMGSTYDKVKEHADKEWKFYRYCLMKEYDATTPIPPPFNLVYLFALSFYKAIRACIKNKKPVCFGERKDERKPLLSKEAPPSAEETTLVLNGDKAPFLTDEEMTPAHTKDEFASVLSKQAPAAIHKQDMRTIKARNRVKSARQRALYKEFDEKTLNSVSEKQDATIDEMRAQLQDLRANLKAIAQSLSQNLK